MGEMIPQEREKKPAMSEDRKPGTRKLFYGSIGLVLGGLLLLAIGAIYSWTLLVLLGVVCFFGAGLVQLNWLLRKIG
jgi:hypothetical protein